MKYFLILLVFLLFNLPSYSQLRYSALNDLKTIAKKEDFKALKIFLLNNGYSIQELQTNYDHGSYYMLGHITAQKLIGDIIDGVDISLAEYDDYKKLTLIQIYSDHSSSLNVINYAPFSFWLRGFWTSACVSTDLTTPKEFIGNSNYNNLNLIDTTLGRIPAETLNDFISKRNVSEKNEYSFFSLINTNPRIGELKHEELTFIRREKGTLLMLKIETKIIKGQNINISQNNKILHIPLKKYGKTYLVTIKFGKLIKTYVLDSGASDMSIDEETFNYFENSNQLKIENRLTNAKYQLADGSVVELKRVRVPSFLINDILIKNVDATIVQNGKPLLLGKSFLDSFKSWKIDNETQTLVIELF